MEITRAKKELEILENVILQQLIHFEEITGLLISNFTLLTCETTTMGSKVSHDLTDVKIKIEI